MQITLLKHSMRGSKCVTLGPLPRAMRTEREPTTRGSSDGRPSELGSAPRLVSMYIGLAGSADIVHRAKFSLDMAHISSFL